LLVGQLQQLRHDQPFELATDRGLQQHTPAAQKGGSLPCSGGLRAQSAQLKGDIGDGQQDVGWSFEHIPAQGLAVERQRTRNGEAPVDKGVDATTAALEVLLRGCRDRVAGLFRRQVDKGWTRSVLVSHRS
jgi:hypothetical protein